MTHPFFMLALPSPRILPALLALTLAGLASAPALTLDAQAETKYRRVWDARTKQYYYVPERTTTQKAKDVLRTPIAKQAAVGAAVGVAAGALSDRASVLKGAGIGALAGAGTGLLDTSTTLQDKPMVKTMLKGAIIGTGTSAVLDRSKVKGAAAGAAAGAGVHLLKNVLSEEEGR